MHWGTGLIGCIVGVMIGWLICARVATGRMAEMREQISWMVGRAKLHDAEAERMRVR